MSGTVVDQLHAKFTDLLTVLDKSNELSLRIVADDNFRKSLLMAAASYFEQNMTSAVLAFAEEVTSKDHILTWFVKNKAVSRQYHTWFDWKGENANSFFALFGDNFKKHIKMQIEYNDELESSVKAFLEIGRERNRLVHQNYGSFTIEKTFEEIFTLYSKAMVFITWFPNAIRDFSENTSSADNREL